NGEGARHGLGRNLITLLAAGQRYALLDDDFVLPLHRHPDFAEGLGFSAQAMAARTYPAQREALEDGESISSDPFAHHLQLCGRRIGEFVDDGVDGCTLARAQLRGLAPSRLPLLDGDTRVLASINGHRGDVGSGGLAWLYLLDGEAGNAFASDRQRYLDTIAAPQVWYGVRRFRAARYSHYTPFMVDNSQLMPCVSAEGRSEDAQFAAFAGLLHGEGA